MNPTRAPSTQPIQPPRLAPTKAKKPLIDSQFTIARRGLRAGTLAKLIQLDRSYETYRQRTTRQIPVVLLEPAAEA